MSLINDALKRASQVQKRQPREAPIDSPMEPVVTHHAQRSRLPLFAGMTLAVALLAAGWFLWRWWDAQNRTLDEMGSSHPSFLRPFMGKKKFKPVAMPDRDKPSLRESTQDTAIGTPVPDAVPVPIQSAAFQVSRPVPQAKTVPAPLPVAPVAMQPNPPPAPNPVVESVPKPPPAPFPNVKVSAIFYRPGKPLAVVDTVIAKVGDTVGGVRVLKIEPHRVVLEWQGQTKEYLIDGP